MIWPGEVCHGMWNGIVLYALRHCHRLQSRSHVHVAMEWPKSVGDPVHTYRTHSQVEGFLHACSVHTYSACSLWAGIVDREIVNV